MINEDRRIDEKQRVLLKSLIGKNLVKVEAAIAAPPNVAWNTVRLHAEGCSLDVNCFLEKVKVNDDGDTEEFGVISVNEAPYNRLDVPAISSPTEEILINRKIEGVSIFETSTTARFDGNAFCKKQFTKTIVFQFSDECMVIDKLAWFDEMLRVSFGESSENLLYNESQDWESEEDEIGVSFDYSINSCDL